MMVRVFITYKNLKISFLADFFYTMEKLRTYREKQLKKEDEKLYNEIIQYGSIFLMVKKTSQS